MSYTSLLVGLGLCTALSAGMATRSAAYSREAAFLADNAAAMAKMHREMHARPTGDVDRGFVAMMVALWQKVRRGQHISIDDAGALYSEHSLGQERCVEHAELLRALAQLSDNHRTVLLLVAVEDLSYAEAALVLDVPLGTVMSRLSRAREALGRLLRGEPATREQRVNLRRVK